MNRAKNGQILTFGGKSLKDNIDRLPEPRPSLQLIEM